MTDTVGAKLTEFGIFANSAILGNEGADAARLVEDLGFGALWIAGSPQLPDLRPLLEATESLVVGTAIANIWRYEATEMAADWEALERDFPGRAVAGIGAGHSELDDSYKNPLAAARRYLEALDEAGQPPVDRRLLAAMAPRMLELAASRAAGSVPYFVPVSHTRFAREQLGEGPLLAPELSCVVDEDPARAREKIRDFTALYLSLNNYRAAILRGGDFEEDDLDNGGSERLLDAVIPHGSAEGAAAVAREHLAAGADHVSLQVVGTESLPREEWTALAAVLFS